MTTPTQPRRHWILVGALLLVIPLMIGAYMSSQRRADKKPEPSTKFDPKQAMTYLERICAIGPRMTAQPGMVEQQTILKRHFEALGAKVEMQAFEVKPPSQRQRRFQGNNMLVRWDPDAKSRVLLSCHYDTRPFPDEELLERNKKARFIGANDGASGVAFLMELGRMMKSIDRKVGVDFVFFDAEEFIFDRSVDQLFLGSMAFAKVCADPKQPNYKYEAVINLDMIADRDLQIHPDQRSAAVANKLVKEVWGIAEELGVSEFKPNVKWDIQDDHMSFHQYGIPAIDLIDFDYPYWHRIGDLPDKCSGESLVAVSKVIIEWIKRRKPVESGSP